MVARVAAERYSPEENMADLAPIKLRRSRLFEELDDSVLESVAAAMRLQTFVAGSTIFAQFDTSNDVDFILDGRVRVTLYSRSGKEVTFRDLAAGDMFGELAALDGEPRSAHVIALTEVALASMSREDFHRLLRRHPDFAMLVLRKLSHLVRLLSERVYQFSTPVPTRVCAELLRRAEEAPLADNVARIVPAPKHAEIANCVNTHREAVSRTMSDLMRQGILRRGSGELIVLQVDRLRHLADH
ncbi:MAG: Crp/Fnr family transcriptional regulator [Geminicoccaceae bacterium]